MATRRERLEAKVQKREEWAGKASERSEQRFDAAHKIADGIPLGQPILIGHHSERHARRDQARIEGNMRKGVEEMKLAQRHTSKAGGLADQLERSVFSDDTDAVAQLRARIAGHEAQRDRMKKVNALYKKKDAAGLTALGLNLDALTVKLAAAGAYWGSAPHLPYELTNLGARIRSDKERITDIERQQTRAAKAEANGGITIDGPVGPDCGVAAEIAAGHPWTCGRVAGHVGDHHPNSEWIRVTFAEKPEREILDALRAAGYHWGAGSWCGPRNTLPAIVTGGAA